MEINYLKEAIGARRICFLKPGPEVCRLWNKRKKQLHLWKLHQAWADFTWGMGGSFRDTVKDMEVWKETSVMKSRISSGPKVEPGGHCGSWSYVHPYLDGTWIFGLSQSQVTTSYCSSQNEAYFAGLQSRD